MDRQLLYLCIIGITSAASHTRIHPVEIALQQYAAPDCNTTASDGTTNLTNRCNDVSCKRDD